MKHIFLAIALLLSSHIARSAPLGAVVQTWHHDPQTNVVTVTIVNTSDKEITAFILTLRVTNTSGAVSQYNWMRDLVNATAYLEQVKGTPAEQGIRDQVGPESIPARGSYDEKIPVVPDFKDFGATLEAVAFQDKTAQATSEEALKPLIDQRKAMALSIQKANEIITSAKESHSAATNIQKLLDTWKATTHVADMNEGALRAVVHDLQYSPDLKSYVAIKEKERLLWADQANLTLTGGPQ